MTDGHDLERRVAAFYATEAPPRAPDRVLLDALATIDTTRQRRELALVPWRIQTMNNNARLAMAAVAVIAVGALGFAILQPGSGSSVGAPNPSPSASPSAPPASPATPSPSRAPSPPALTGSFTSAIHGLSMSYPATWTVVPATEDAWTVGVEFTSAGSDWIHDPDLKANLFLVLGSAALDGNTGEEWAATVFADPEADCGSAPEPITVDGAAGLICRTYALTWSGDTGYSIRLYTSNDNPKVGETYGRAWFDDVLATVQLPAQP